jgi:CRISPR-associated exonuclease Cas4
MMQKFIESDCLPLSALQHILFCERQCALIHVEGLWAENVLTAEGRHMHETVDEQGTSQIEGGVRVARGVPLRCLRLGLIGKADAVEFHPSDEEGAEIKGTPGKWKPFPVEYKRGKPKKDRSDEVQLCAQALCLEEMLEISISEGALFYGRTRRRVPITFDADLRRHTEETAARLHLLIRSGVTPKAVYEPKCDSCSLFSLCLPKANSNSLSANHFLNEIFERTP